MKQYRVIRDISKSHNSLDKEKFLNVKIDSDKGLMPLSLCSKHIEEYEQYIKEKDACDRYRFVFTINPVCSNVLFNRKSEIVYSEGSDGCVVVGDKPVSVNDTGVSEYITKCKGSGFSITHDNLIDDTSFSHDKIGDFSYHCGLDILSNHFMRNKNFNVVNKTQKPNSRFNTIADDNRFHDGGVVKEYLNNITYDGSRYHMNTTMDDTHLYMYEDLMSITESIVKNINERDGWFGFINKTNMKIKNFGIHSINRCINNMPPNDKVDFYPDRSLFSVIPKENRYRKRFENNWNYCLTYPYKVYRDNPMVEIPLDDGTRLNGMKADIVEHLSNISCLDGGVLRTDITVSFMTPFNNGLVVDDEVDITFVYDNGGSYESRWSTDRCKIVSVGYNNQFENTVFSVDVSGLYGSLQSMLDSYNNSEIDADKIHARVSKVVDGVVSDYYIRLFRKVPNFNNEKYKPYNVTGRTDSEFLENLEELVDKTVENGSDFSYSLNRLCFSTNAYGDDIGQIVMDEDVDIKGLIDHLGRPVTELYLTIVKNNKGYSDWYEKGVCNTEDVEYSHCFGKLTSGFDLFPTETDYNVHCIHNVDVDSLPKKIHDFMSENFNLEKSPKNLENNEGEITIDGDSCFDIKGVFFGDYVNFLPQSGTENVLEGVKFRFNTYQRESVDSKFSDFVYSEIITDDYELNDKRSMSSKLTCGFSVKKMKYNSFSLGFSDIVFPFNIQQEGYYYAPHYKIQVREFKDSVMQDYHRHMKIVGDIEVLDDSANMYRIRLSKPYGLCSGDTVYYYDEGKRYSGVIKSDTKGTTSFDIEFEQPLRLGEKTYTKLFRENKLKPRYAYEFNDNTGRYTWRDLKKEVDYGPDDELYDMVFTNGRKYLNKEFVLYLRRQDPYGLYGLSTVTEDLPTKFRDIIIDGEYKDITGSMFEPERIEDDCGLNINDYLTNRVNVLKTKLEGQVTKVDKFLKDWGLK